MKSLKARNSFLADAHEQLEIIELNIVVLY